MSDEKAGDRPSDHEHAYPPPQEYTQQQDYPNQQEFQSHYHDQNDYLGQYQQSDGQNQQYQQYSMSAPTPMSLPSMMNSDSGNRNLIVNYIPQSYTENDLLELFKPYGQIESCKIVMDKVSGQSLGYGFVKFINDQDAANAVNGLTGTQIMNKTLKVSVAKPSASAVVNLYVSGLDPNINEETLRSWFVPYGNVVETKILVGKPLKF